MSDVDRALQSIYHNPTYPANSGEVQHLLRSLKALGKSITLKQIKDWVELMRHAWTVISQDMAGTGVVIFKRLFTQYPQLSKYFKKFMTLQEDGRYDWDLGGLERHALLVMQALEAAVDNLDDTQTLSAILFELGHTHAHHHVQEEMFDVSIGYS
ncbi:cytoglobin-2-like [Limulus polyphemus]|uniref:Cytoglobin-2-like n=1 Tax=Limulus polyphemus TaxID=6850 RepID=A0ABM1BP41_LIMPO|nr:cytoglobin-2-like [Limulus polyphemus]